MAERQRTEISAELMDGARLLAERRGVPVEEVLEEAVREYLAFRKEGASLLGGPTPTYMAEVQRAFDLVTDRGAGEQPPPRDPFLALLDHTGSRFDLDEDEAERIAVEEQHAWRRERREQAERERAEG
ncbi:MAG: hypothetical protein AVDCRST_MAG02-1723 [uncultured Rubrobacteraceae bacterium]|uniref:Uncharacterized protein n=1 Tax=uncultured Rubrobacteraceae bacterium TaxID=349277 RepID=A0A6J4QZ07_9ACTN|nr:MAG: hypothetical protein AVDCRST_MAG02-1723 [uncultured Rubrobacteraceae bacterium]